LTHFAAQEVEGSAHTEERRCTQVADVLSHPEFLFRGAQPDPHDVSP
jgi:hypothetical protein